MKSKSLALILVASGALSIGSSAALAAPTFTNASFETGDDTGWTVSNPFLGVNDWAAFPGLGFPAMDGTYAVWFGALDNKPGSSYGQTVGGFSVGATYKVSFGMIPEWGSTSNPNRTVATALLSLTGANVGSQSFAADCTDPNNSTDFFSCAPGWQDKSLTFTALASSIGFTWTADLANSPASWEFGFDNIRIEQVPAPATLALLGIGLAGLAATRRRRQ